ILFLLEQIKLCAAAAPFIDHTMSMSLWVSNPTVKILNTLYMMAWELGLKTLQYYLRRKPPVEGDRLSDDLRKILEYDAEFKKLAEDKREQILAIIKSMKWGVPLDDLMVNKSLRFFRIRLRKRG